MQLPITLKLAIEKLLSKEKISSLSQASQDLSQMYRHKKSSDTVNLSKFHQAYLASRLPATYASMLQALQELVPYPAINSIQNILDLGSGPGTTLWSIHSIFPQIKNFTLIEKDPQFIEIGKALSAQLTPDLNTTWIEQDIQKFINNSKAHDMTIMSYTLGELLDQDRINIISKIWNITQKIFLCIEPGTPDGFHRIREVRQKLINLGAYLIAPCPHHLTCPMPEDNWCHFRARIERSSLHRHVKSATLNYEDEKFSYVIASKIPIQNLAQQRILRNPIQRPGRVIFELCTPKGLTQTTISRKQGELYKKARKADWGDSLQTTI